MPRRQTNATFRHEIAVCLKKAIREAGLSKGEAAQRLGVKRQTLWLYLKEKKAPGPEVLRRASKFLKLTLSDGTVLNSGAFGPEKGPSPTAMQMRLFDAFEELRPNQIETKLIGRVGKYFEFRVRIKVAS
jgi:transcriptional regulator with XRE-family HTH domain